MRRLLVLVALAACVALIVLLGRDATFRRAPAGVAEGESPAGGQDAQGAPAPAATAEPPLPERDPTFLPGHVYGPDGRPVDKAEVRVVYPKTFDATRSGEDGAYELPFERSGRFLIEAALTTELAPERAWADIPEEGDPAPLDFHLQAARGPIFGEVTLEGVPVEDGRAYLSLTDGAGADKPVHDLALQNGYFNFYLDPPKDVPLRLDVTSPYGTLPAPLRLVWTGKPMDVGTLELTPYPSLRFRMRLPDGSHAKGVIAYPKEDLRDFQYRLELPRPHADQMNRLALPEKQDVTIRRVFIAAPPLPIDWEARGESPLFAPSFMVEREVTLLFGRPQELEVVVRPGPLVVASRLLDRAGRGLRGRLRCGENEAATGDDGAFRLTVPHGGLHIVHLVALDVPGVGPVELAHGVPAQSMLLDADDPRDCVYDTGGRILFLGSAPCSFVVTNTWQVRGKRSEAWSAAAGSRPCCLSPPLDPRAYLWTWDDTRGTLRSGEVRVEDGALAVVDVR